MRLLRRGEPCRIRARGSQRDRPVRAHHLDKPRRRVPLLRHLTSACVSSKFRSDGPMSDGYRLITLGSGLTP